MLKKILSVFLTVSLVCSTFCTVSHGDGSFLYVGDSSPEVIFGGSVSGHYLLLSGSGIVSAFGNNEYGQCGVTAGKKIDKVNYIDFENKVKKVSAGDCFSLALDEKGTAWGWGSNAENQLGISDSKENVFEKPQKIAENISDIAASKQFSILLNNSGELMISGRGEALKKLEFPEIKHISAGYNSIAAIGADNIVYFMQTDDINNIKKISLPQGCEVQSAAVGEKHIAVKCINGENFEIYTYGDNSKSQLGVKNAVSAEEAVKSLSLSKDEYSTVNVFAGRYSTVVDAWNNMSYSDRVTEYAWGTDTCDVYDGGCRVKETLEEPTGYGNYYHIIDMQDDKYIAFDYMVSEIIVFGKSTDFQRIPLIEPTEKTDTMYKYQYDNLDYNTYNVNFVSLNKDTFAEDSENYAYWEYVNNHQFRIKIKDFDETSSAVMSSAVKLSKNVTGENRIIGTYGPEVWNFDRHDISFKADNVDIPHGQEDGILVEISAYKLQNRSEKALEIPAETEVFFEKVTPITEKTKLGLYIYGLPNGTTAEVKSINGNKILLQLHGNSSCDMDYDSSVKLCYVYDTANKTQNGCIGNFDPYDISACERSVKGLTIKASENTPEMLTASTALIKGKENGKEVKLNISGGEFAGELTASNWSIDGSDELKISDVKRIDDNNAIAVISGNSSDKYSDAEIKIVCGGDEYTDSRERDEETGSYSNVPLYSNSVKIEKQTKSSSGGGTVSTGSSMSKPTASVKGGTVKRGTSVQLSSNVDGAIIYYTTDGTTPTENSGVYTAPIKITDNMTLKFIAVSGNKKSAVQTIEYAVKSAEAAIKENSENIKYITALDNQPFYPDEAITRYEILQYISSLFDIENLGEKSDFSDVDAKHEDIVNLFAGAGLIEGYTDNTFKGNEGLTRAEFVKILDDILKPEVKENSQTFTDIKGHWCEKYISEFMGLGYVSGYPDNTFKPDAKITRAEAVAVLNRIAGIKALDANADSCFTDVTNKHWASGLIYAATAY